MHPKESGSLSSFEYQVAQKADTAGMFTRHFLSMPSQLQLLPKQPENFILSGLFPGEMELEMFWLGVSGTRWKEGGWITTYRNTESSPSCSCSVQAHTHHSHSLKRLHSFEELYVRTMKKPLNFELTLLWSPPVASPIHAHGPFECLMQIHLGSQGPSGIGRKPPTSQTEQTKQADNRMFGGKRDYAGNRRK